MQGKRESPSIADGKECIVPILWLKLCSAHHCQVANSVTVALGKSLQQIYLKQDLNFNELQGYICQLVDMSNLMSVDCDHKSMIFHRLP